MIMHVMTHAHAEPFCGETVSRQPVTYLQHRKKNSHEYLEANLFFSSYTLDREGRCLRDTVPIVKSPAFRANCARSDRRRQFRRSKRPAVTIESASGDRSSIAQRSNIPRPNDIPSDSTG